MRAHIALVLIGGTLALAPANAAAQEHGAGHQEHGAQPSPTPGDRQAGESSETDHAHDAAQEPTRRLFQSDMNRMAGMTPRDPTASSKRPGWQWMTLGILRGQYNRQSGASGGETFESTNWSMVMTQRDVAGGRLTLMLMNSLEPATLGKEGSPQLFQAGETFEGRPLVDRQHPHDFVMNLSATYRRRFGDRAAWWLQVAPRGEPALGPTTYMHRASAGDNPAAILSHHFQDSTHISDQVVTIGLGWRRVAIEASAFHGEEPDEGRWDLDPGALDSASGRLKVWLSDRWSAQISHGFLKSPEALEPGDTRRTTASVHYGEDGGGPLAVSMVFGRNSEEHGTFYGYLIEGAYKATTRDELFVRAEQVDRDSHLLETKALASEDGGHDDIVRIRALTLGYLHDVKIWPKVSRLGEVSIGLGGDVSAYSIPSELEVVYGDRPVSLHGFVRLRWGSPHAGHGGEGAGSHH